MIPVFNQTVDGSKDLDFEQFSKNLVQICTEHQEQGRASAFALIIYDFNDPHILEILEKHNYWNSLNHLSGKWLSIFTIFDKPLQEQFDDRLKIPSRGLIKLHMHPVKSENSEESYREIINKYFFSKQLISPSVLFFQVYNGEIIDYDLIALRQNKIEDGFLELQELIKTSVDTIKHINKEETVAHFGDNTKEFSNIYREIKGNIEKLEVWKKIDRRIPIATKIVKFSKVISGL